MNLWFARMGIYGPLIEGNRHREGRDKDGERRGKKRSAGGGDEGMCATFRINSRIKWPAARHPYGRFDGTGSRRLTFVRLIN